MTAMGASTQEITIAKGVTSKIFISMHLHGAFISNLGNSLDQLGMLSNALK